MANNYKNATLTLTLLVSPGLAFAQTADPTLIKVTSSRIDRSLYDTPAAISVVGEEQISQGQQRVRLDESLVDVPGVYLQNRDNFAQGQRIAIRGFGARAPFGVRGITVVVDGIPYTLPDGQAQLDAIDLDSAQRIEVIRGPSSVLYGNAAGGVISVTSDDGRYGLDGTRLRAEGGSHSYGKVSASNGGVNGLWSHHISASALNFEGYREQSEVEKYLVNGKIRRELGEGRALTAVVNLLDNPRSEDPGALTEEQVAEDRRQAGRFTEEFDTGQTVDQQVAGLQYQDMKAGPGELYLKSFYLRRDFEQQLPFPGDSLIGYERHYYGASAEYHQSLALSGLPFQYATGIEAARQEDDRWRRNVEFSGEVTGITVDEVQTASDLAFFAQGDLDLTDRLALSLGGRYDRVNLEIEDHFPSDGDQSGERTFREWSGSAGLSYRYRPSHQAYLNTGTSFETPTFTEFANPDGSGGFNPGIEPQESWNRELGLRGNFGRTLDYDLALFSIRVRDELVPFNVDGRDFFRNAGESSREGLELAIGWQFLPHWRIDSALTLARYEFDNFTLDGDNFDGNRIPGLPEKVWNTQLQWQDNQHRFVTLETLYTGDIYADNANTVEVDDYWLVNLRAGDGWTLGDSTLLKAYAGLRNLLDEEHFANVRINAFGGRYFEPAPERTFYAGLELTF